MHEGVVSKLVEINWSIGNYSVADNCLHSLNKTFTKVGHIIISLGLWFLDEGKNIDLDLFEP